MLIIVASRNIFRRELTSYVLGEAGYLVSEARDLNTLLAALVSSAPAAAIVDAQLEGAGGAVGAIRQRSALPLLWIAEPERARPLLAGDAGPCDYLAWPYHPELLLERLTALLARAEPAVGEDDPCERYAGSAE